MVSFGDSPVRALGRELLLLTVIRHVCLLIAARLRPHTAPVHSDSCLSYSNQYQSKAAHPWKRITSAVRKRVGKKCAASTKKYRNAKRLQIRHPTMPIRKKKVIASTKNCPWFSDERGLDQGLLVSLGIRAVHVAPITSMAPCGRLWAEYSQ